MKEQGRHTHLDPEGLIDELNNSISLRKIRLFAAACCRNIWDLLDEECKGAVEVVERQADGLAALEELRLAAVAASQTRWGEALQNAARAVHAALYDSAILEYYVAAPTSAASEAFLAYSESSLDSKWAFARYASIYAAYAKAANMVALDQRVSREAVVRKEYMAQCLLLHDIVGRSSGPLVVEDLWLAWNDGYVLRLARGLYGARKQGNYSALREALTQAGCANQTVLAHCDDGVKHVHGCWVIDLLLGK